MVLPKISAGSTVKATILKPVIARRLYDFWQEHGLPLLLYLVLSVGLTWPLVRNFTGALVGTGDARHNLWVLWHFKEAFLGHQPLFYTEMLYYPMGISLLAHSLGPIMALFTLPFWSWGPAAAYNGTVLIGCWLTGYFMYLLARGLNFDRGTSLLAGTILSVAPIHLIPISAGHIDRTFLGLLPLTLLALHRALNLKRNAWWTVATALMLLLTLLHAGLHFVSIVIGSGFLIIISLVTSERAARWPILRRVMLIVVSSLILAGPQILAMLSVSSNEAIIVDKNLYSYDHQPDLIQFLLPARSTSRFLGSIFSDFLAPYTLASHETGVFLSWTGLSLSILAFVSGNRRARAWSLFTLLFVLLALGPDLKVLGKSEFTEYELPIILPYAFLTSLPGLDFLRTPGRLMIVGFVGFGITAAFGLAWLQQWLPVRWRYPVTALALVLILFENWPQPWGQEPLRPVPDFYRQIAQDEEVYGVFDLPVRPFEQLMFSSWHVSYSSYYQMYQMTHGKGIASGYISRVYTTHPIFGHFVSDIISGSRLQDRILVNGEQADRYANAQFELARNNYRYVVFHKPLDWYSDYRKDSWGEERAMEFIEAVFGQQAPLVNDNLVTVYEVNPVVDTSKLTTTIAIRNAEHYVQSPATFYVTSPRAQVAHLEVTPEYFAAPGYNFYPGQSWLTLESTGIPATNVATPHETTTLPLALNPGSQVITLTLRSEDNGDSLFLDFFMETINLNTQVPLPDDIRIDGRVQSGENQPHILAAYGTGWYNPESWDASGQAWRWATSPAQLLIYSVIPQQVQLEMTPAALYEPDSADGKGSEGILTVVLNNLEQQAWAVHVGQPIVNGVMLRAGWNHITFALEAGNFRPIDIQPGNGDARMLSFALGEINIVRYK